MDEKVLWRADVAVIQDTQSAIATTPSREHVSMLPSASVGCNTVERLVGLRSVHQTQRAAKSVRSRGEPRTARAQDAKPTTNSTAAERQKLCEQMADVLRRAGTGLERCARWRSAPGTLEPSEASQLNGNSANAEAAAKDRVNSVSSPFL